MKHVIVAPAGAIAQWVYRNMKEFRGIPRKDVRFVTRGSELEEVLGSTATFYCVISDRPFVLTPGQRREWETTLGRVAMMCKERPARYEFKEVKVP